MPAPIGTDHLKTKQEVVQAELYNAVVDKDVNQQNAITEIRRCIKAGANPDCFDECILLVAAFDLGRFRVAEELLKQGAKLDFISESQASDNTATIHNGMISFREAFHKTGSIDILTLILKYDTKNYFGTLKDTSKYNFGTPNDMLERFFEFLKKRPDLVPKEVDLASIKNDIDRLVEEHLEKRFAATASWRSCLPFSIFGGNSGYQTVATASDEKLQSPTNNKKMK